MKTDYGALARDILTICKTAQAKQQAFLEHKGLSLETIRGLSAADRKALDREYAAFDYVPWRPWFA